MRKILVISMLLIFPMVTWAADQNVLNWIDNANNETGFNIFRKTIPTPIGSVDQACQVDGAPFTTLTTVGANVTTYTDAAVVQGTTYCYDLTAVNSAGSSPASNIRGRTVPFTVPASPSDLSVQ